MAGEGAHGRRRRRRARAAGRGRRAREGSAAARLDHPQAAQPPPLEGGGRDTGGAGVSHAPGDPVAGEPAGGGRAGGGARPGRRVRVRHRALQPGGTGGLPAGLALPGPVQLPGRDAGGAGRIAAADHQRAREVQHPGRGREHAARLAAHHGPGRAPAPFLHRRRRVHQHRQGRGFGRGLLRAFPSHGLHFRQPRQAGRQERGPVPGAARDRGVARVPRRAAARARAANLVHRVRRRALVHPLQPPAGRIRSQRCASSIRPWCAPSRPCPSRPSW